MCKALYGWVQVTITEHSKTREPRLRSLLISLISGLICRFDAITVSTCESKEVIEEGETEQADGTDSRRDGDGRKRMGEHGKQDNRQSHKGSMYRNERRSGDAGINKDTDATSEEQNASQIMVIEGLISSLVFTEMFSLMGRRAAGEEESGEIELGIDLCRSILRNCARTRPFRFCAVLSDLIKQATEEVISSKILRRSEANLVLTGTLGLLTNICTDDTTSLSSAEVFPASPVHRDEGESPESPVCILFM